MTATFLLKRDSVVEAHLGDVGPSAVDDEVAEAFAEVGLVVEAAAISEHLQDFIILPGNKIISFISKHDLQGYSSGHGLG